MMMMLMMMMMIRSTMLVDRRLSMTMLIDDDDRGYGASCRFGEKLFFDGVQALAPVDGATLGIQQVVSPIRSLDFEFLEAKIFGDHVGRPRNLSFQLLLLRIH